MIDVHEPHEGIHSWKDILLHIGIITVGLLIAIALEQTVVWMHHLHERHQLEADLHAEAVRNLAIMDSEYRSIDLLIANQAANRDRVDTIITSGGKTRLAWLPFGHGSSYLTPLATVWSTAKESELVGLLPRNEAKFYDRVYREYDLMQAVFDIQRNSSFKLQEFNSQYNSLHMGPSDLVENGSPLVVPDLSRMSVEDLREESRLLSQLWYDWKALRTRVDIFYGAESTVLGDKHTEEQVRDNIAKRVHTRAPEGPAVVPGVKH